MATSVSPSSSPWAAETMACRPEPQAVDIECRRFLGDAGVHGRNPRQVGITGFGRYHRAHYHVADLFGGQPERSMAARVMALARSASGRS